MAGLLRTYAGPAPKPVRILVLVACAEAAGSLLWKTLALSWLTGVPFFVQLSVRTVPPSKTSSPFSGFNA